jgi:hypothetical protein
MINQDSIDALDKAKFSKRFCKPLYDTFCFSRIPATICHLLTGEKSEKCLPSSCYSVNSSPYDLVILIFLDGFGWRFFEKYADHPFLQRFSAQGIVSKVSSQFPSTTAAHVTCISTGLDVGENGIYEWFHYEPLVDRIIAPLLFSFSGDKVVDSLNRTGLSPEQFFPFPTIYQNLHAKGASSYVFQHESICHSAYSRTLGKGAHPIAYFTLMQALQGIVEEVNAPQKQPAYCFLYFADIDSVGHREGVDSPAFEQAILHCLDCLENELMKKVKLSGKKVAVAVTADHGMVAVSPKNTIYLNRLCPDLKDMIQTNKEGKQLVPAGSCRDFFLHIKSERLAEAETLFNEILKEKAEVYRVDDLISQGFFGHASQRLRERVGNLVVLPYENEAVWWYEKHKFEQHFYAAHGGLTRGEMETIFLFLPM